MGYSTIVSNGAEKLRNHTIGLLLILGIGIEEDITVVYWRRYRIEAKACSQ
jgi:hypothetical protein